jgi:hypothetical protein
LIVTLAQFLARTPKPLFEASLEERTGCVPNVV